MSSLAPQPFIFTCLNFKVNVTVACSPSIDLLMHLFYVLNKNAPRTTHLSLYSSVLNSVSSPILSSLYLFERVFARRQVFFLSVFCVHLSARGGRSGRNYRNYIKHFDSFSIEFDHWKVII